jgi:PST family polysaccharide transporter
MNQADKFKRLVCTEAIRKDLRSSSVRAAGFNCLAGSVDFMLRIGSTAVLARLVLPQQFGLVMMVTAVTAIADQFRDLGLSTATVQRKEITHQEVTNLFWINVLAGAVIALIVCAASPLISAFYHEPRLTLVTCVLATNFLWNGLMVQHQALLTRVLKLGQTAAVRVVSSLISTTLGVWLAWKGFGYWALVWKEVLRCALLPFGMWLCFPWIPGSPFVKTKVWGLVRFGAHLSVANILSAVGAGADRFLLGRFWGAGPVAMYRQAYQLLVLPVEQLIGPVYYVAQPGLSMLQTEPSLYRRFYQKMLTVVCAATMPVSLFVAVYSAEVTRVLLGRKWLEAAPLLLILSLDAFIKQPVVSAAFVLITRGRSRMYLALVSVQSVTLILLMMAGVHWGARGVAMADVAVTYLLMTPTLYYSFKDSPITIGTFFSTIARPAVASILMAILLRLLHEALPPLGAPAFLAIGSLVGAFAFVGFWALFPGGRAELIALIADVRAALRRKQIERPVDSALAVAVSN